VPQLVVVDQIFIAERDAEHPLRHHRLDAVLDQLGIPTIREAGGEPADQPDHSIGRAEQQLREEIERAAGDTWGEIVEQQREWARERDRVQGLELEP
jgi:hypothetical protein